MRKKVNENLFGKCKKCGSNDLKFNNSLYICNVCSYKGKISDWLK